MAGKVTMGILGMMGGIVGLYYSIDKMAAA
jgi:hypothetical protein